MTANRPAPAAWHALVERMFLELRSGAARSDAYWAQQLAYAPVLIYVVGRRVRSGALSEDSRADLLRAVELAFAGLGALPDDAGADPVALHLVARRQAAALASGRRARLVRLATLLGGRLDPRQPGILPGRMLRPYPLLGRRLSEPYS